MALVYVRPTVLLPTYTPLARRFVESYQQNPPGEHSHELHVVLNGPKADIARREFESLPVTFHTHNNFAKDLGAFFLCSVAVSCDLLVCLGSHIHFPKPGWLDRLLDVYLHGGPGLYGCWGFAYPSLHIRTTAFWCPPALLSSYPHPLDDDHRYEFEHGPKTSLLRWAVDSGFPARVVTQTRVLSYPNFEPVPRADSLMLDQHTDKHCA